MDQTDRTVERLLKENLKLSRENNRLLKKIRRGNLVSAWLRVFLFIFIIGLPFFLYRYYFQDYVTEYRSAYEGLKQDVQELKNLPDRLSF